MEPKRTPQTVQVSSLRLDSLVARAYGLSREESSRLFLRGQVFVNGAPTERGEQAPREGQIISVRGYGRFLFAGEAGTTRKGRLNVLIEKYEG
jgi:RNA-binding protein YlmH